MHLVMHVCFSSASQVKMHGQNKIKDILLKIFQTGPEPSIFKGNKRFLSEKCYIIFFYSFKCDSLNFFLILLNK